MINLSKRKKEIFGLILIVFSVLTIISLIGHDPTINPYGVSLEEQAKNTLGRLGVWVSYYHFITLGYLSIAFPIIFSIIGYTMVTNREFSTIAKPVFYIFIVLIYLSILMGFIGYLSNNNIFDKYLTGILGQSLFIFINHHLGFFGSLIFLLISFIIIVTGIFEITIQDFFVKIFSILKNIYSKIKTIIFLLINRLKGLKKKDNFSNEGINEIDLSPEEDMKNEKENKEEQNNPIDIENDSNNEIKIKHFDDKTDIDHNDFNKELEIEQEDEVKEGDLDLKQKAESKYFNYKLPTLDYLQDPIEIVEHNDDELREKGKQLKYALKTFAVDGEVVKISPGPIISLFEIEPAEGVRVNKFVNLSDDLARVMKAQRVRIIAPIPGSRSVGVELPNEKHSIVYLKSILNSQKYIESQSKLTIALGKTTTGDAYIFDLCKMPHLLVAGATGSGKSVCINTIIISILYKAKPDEVKFILMDPKKLELSTYKSLVGYHLITAPNLDEYVMTKVDNSVGILNAAISEMERRFQVFSDARVRNIEEYHAKQAADSNMEKVPYVVVLIDELADLMMTSGRAVEDPITRLAQKARAVGIHLVLATQRPSVDVITGLIKSNFPSRISFQVSSKIDSRTILDQMGAEKLLGKGDMLFLLPGSASPIRLHNAFVTLEEIEQIMEHISSQPKPDELKLPEVIIKQKENEFDLSDNQDELLKDAAKLVVDHQQASVSLLQRKFRIGYSRAGRLIDELESMGIVSSYSGSKARDVLVDYSYIEEIFGNSE